MTIPYERTRRKFADDPEFIREREALEDEFTVADAMIRARIAADLTQAQLAERMGVSQPAIAKLESGKSVSLNSLKRYAQATGTKLKVEFIPRPA
ncbi:helix-turn-helix domain-containing protein [Desulfonatronum thioautotrophicum]|uniref:helix-turn-helix domain-containing protein n=1 Tax=Desulfonatronum thioautotrophicum TaxID=617001 RepID=UPI0005EAF6B2|nr:helix-turn-helix transcriptional regulator [Desulfonatronum thioautotrophicum]